MNLKADAYQRFFEHSSVPSMILCENVIIDCNIAALSLFNMHTKESLKNKPWLVFIKELLEELKSDLNDELLISVPFDSQFNQDYKVVFDEVNLQASSFVYFEKQNVDKHLIKDCHTLKLGHTNMDVECAHLFDFVSNLFVQIELGIIIFNYDTQEIVAVNDVLNTLAGYQDHELVSTKLSNLAPKFLFDFKTLDQIETSTDSYLVKIKNNDGKLNFLRLNGLTVSKLINQNFVWLFISELTDLEAMNHALQVSEERLLNAQNQAKLGCWELDFFTGELYWSEQVYKIFELDSDKFLPSYEVFLNTIHPDERSAVQHAYEKSILDKAPYSIKHRLKMPDGRIKYVLENCESYFDENDKVVISKGTVQDITFEYLAQLEIQHLAAIVESSRDFIGIADFDGRVTYINQSGRDMLGFTGNLVAQEWFIPNLYLDNQQSVIFDEMLPSLHKSGRWSGELDMKHFGTKDQRVLCFCDAFRIDDPLTGMPVSFATVSQNITEKTEGELILLQFQSNLKGLVDERTKELSIAKQEAINANNAKSEFLSRMSHELRTPLNAVLGFSQILYDELKPFNDIHRDYLKEIMDAGHHLLSLINEVLDLSRIESRKLDIFVESLLLEELIRMCVSVLHADIVKKDISLIIKGLHKVRVDADKKSLKQVFINILSNSIKYSTFGSQITITSEYVNDDQIAIKISDSGIINLDAQQIHQLFEPFVRISNSHDQVEGAGIGLTISKELLELMGGTIEIESSKNIGTTCLINLPLSKTPEPEKIGQAPENESNFDILYIEDDAINMKLLNRIFSKFPEFSLLEAVNGLEGIVMAKKHMPDLILLDINLPDLNGKKVFEKLRTYPNTSNIPIVAVTANVMHEDILRYKKLGFDDVITKPFVYNELMVKIKEIIESKNI